MAARHGLELEGDSIGRRADQRPGPRGDSGGRRGAQRDEGPDARRTLLGAPRDGGKERGRDRARGARRARFRRRARRRRACSASTRCTSPTKGRPCSASGRGRRRACSRRSRAPARPRSLRRRTCVAERPGSIILDTGFRPATARRARGRTAAAHMLTDRLRVAVLCSRRARASEAARRAPPRGLRPRLRPDASGENLEALPNLGARRVPLVVHPIGPYLRSRGASLVTWSPDGVRPETVALLRPHGPDVVLLSSYLYVLTEPVLEAFPQRIVNVHGSDLDATRAPTAGLSIRASAQCATRSAPASPRRAPPHISSTEAARRGPPILLRSRASSGAADSATRPSLSARTPAHAVNAYALCPPGMDAGNRLGSAVGAVRSLAIASGSAPTRTRRRARRSSRRRRTPRDAHPYRA